MADDWIVGRKAIITFLAVPLGLSADPKAAWRKISRWKKRYQMTPLFHYLPSGTVYMIQGELSRWLEGITREIH